MQIFKAGAGLMLPVPGGGMVPYAAIVPAPTPEDEAALRLAMLADLCPHGSGACGCGAVPRDCSHPDHPDHVFRSYCLECVARRANRRDGPSGEV